MKLFLSSYKFGDNPNDFTSLFSEGRRIGVIGNAKDGLADKEKYHRKIREEVESLNQMGFFAENLDLRSYFTKKDALKKVLMKLDGVWTRGGDPLVLRAAMSLSGFDTLLMSKVGSSPDFIYGGYSAGACVAGRDLSYIGVVDNPNTPNEVYGVDTTWNGLGLVDYEILPHYKSRTMELGQDRLEQYFVENDVKYHPLRDGEVRIVEV